MNCFLQEIQANRSKRDLSEAECSTGTYLNPWLSRVLKRSMSCKQEVVLYYISIGKRRETHLLVVICLFQVAPSLSWDSGEIPSLPVLDQVELSLDLALNH